MATSAPTSLPVKETQVPAGAWTPITDSTFDGKSIIITNIGGNACKIIKQSNATPNTNGIPLPPSTPSTTSALPAFTQVAGYVAYAYSEWGTTVSAEVFA